MNKLALVTGAASGLGVEFSRLLAADAHDLILVDLDLDGLEGVRHDLVNTFGIGVEVHVVDLGKAGAAETVGSLIDKRKIDILINNAGFGLYGFFADTEWQLEESMLHLHVLTLTRLTKLVLKEMLHIGSGRIMNVSSLAAFQPGPLMSVYYASKAYILSFSEAIANEVKGTGVTVTVLAPGWFKTNFQKSTARNSNVEESKAKLHTATAGMVARKAYRAMMAGKTVVVPGFKNRLMSLAPRFIPRKTVTSIIRKIQERLRK
ncbi:MAG: SDR family oxidoreductase [Bacteroidota bacterium]